MLVLALQFSKGIASAGTVWYTFAEHAVAAGPKPVPCAEDRLPENGAGSLKTEEKTKTVDVRSRGGRILRHSISIDRPTSAPTGNWFEPGGTNAHQRLNSSSLERR